MLIVILDSKEKKLLQMQRVKTNNETLTKPIRNAGFKVN